MSLTHEQRYLLEELREYLRRVEKMAARYGVELDEPSNEPGRYGVTPEEVSINERAIMRKDIFKKASLQETVNYYLLESDEP